MELRIYSSSADTAGTIHNFMDLYYSLQMSYLASDLLHKGLSLKEISDAVKIAIKIANAAKVDTRKHFKPIYSAINQELVLDCKLSNVGYGLVLMNANPSIEVVGNFQVHLLTEFFKRK